MNNWLSDDVLRWFAPLYVLMLFLSCFVWRSFRVWRRTGINPLVPNPGDNAHDYTGRVFRLLMGLTAAAVTLFAVDPSAAYVGPLTWLMQPPLRAAGIIILIGALLLTAVAQAQMGDAWRIGVDSKNTTSLVVSGLFKRTRNPIFVGMIAALTGLLLVIPNALTLTLWALGSVLINVQVRLEEEHMAKLHGAAYAAYRARVRRWL